MRFPGWADFLVSADGKEIDCTSYPGSSLQTVRHFFLSHVMPHVLSHRGRLVLHASAVVVEQGALVFLGESGRGKSTLAASFGVQGGALLLADDCLLVKEEQGQLFGTPSYPELRLWPEMTSGLFGNLSLGVPVHEHSDKKRLFPDDERLSFCTKPVPLHAIFLLASPEEMKDPEATTIVPLSRREAFVRLTNHALRLDVNDRGRLGAEFEGFVRWRPRCLFALCPSRETCLASRQCGWRFRNISASYESRGVSLTEESCPTRSVTMDR